MEKIHIKPLTKKELEKYLAQAEYQKKLDEAIGETLKNTKCVPYCLNGNYKTQEKGKGGKNDSKNNNTK